MSVFFSGDEIATITKRLRKLKIDTAVFCSYENRFARSGGLAAVTTNILPYLKEVNNIPTTILITPFHSKIIDESRLLPVSGSFEVLYKNKAVHVEIFKYTQFYDTPASG